MEKNYPTKRSLIAQLKRTAKELMKRHGMSAREVGELLAPTTPTPTCAEQLEAFHK